MSQAWTALTAEGAKQFASSAMLHVVDQEDAQGNERLASVLATVVARFRGTIDSANRIPLSLTAMSVPPEAAGHAYVLAVNAALGAEPQVAKFFETEAGKKMHDAAEAWLKAVSEGASCTEPLDPDPDTVPPGVLWGDQTGSPGSGRVDMTTD